MDLREEAKRLLNELEKDIQEKKIKIALFGQPGAGKSTIINELVEKEIAFTGQQTDVTKEAQIIDYHDLLLVDLPGYGTSKFPPNSYFDTFKINDFDLYICVFSGKFHQADTDFFKELNNNNRICIFVRNKHDDLWQKGKTKEELKKEIVNDVYKQINKNVKVIFTSARDKESGFDILSKEIENNIEPAKKERWIKSSKALTEEHLKQKYESAKNDILIYSGIACANVLNPIPGIDISVDIGILFKLLKNIKEIFGLSDFKIDKYSKILDNKSLYFLKSLTNSTYKDIIISILKNSSKKIVFKESSKWIPIIGQLIAGGISFAITYNTGKYFLDECFNAAEAILKHELKYKD